MKRICLVVLFFWYSTGFSQNTFLESFYTAGTAQNMFGKKTSDSGYLLYGFNGFTGNNLFTKTDLNGIVTFSKYYNLPNDYQVYDAFESQNGYTLLSTGINNSACFIKTDQNGMFISGKSYSSLQGAIQFRWLGQIGSDIYLYGMNTICKMDSSGTMLWTKAYSAFYFNKGAISKNNELFLTGATQGPLSAVFKLDSAGNSIWNVQFQELGGEWIDLTEDSGVIVSSSNFVMKLDFQGAIEWSKFYIVDTAHSLQSWGIKSTEDNGYIIAGNYEPTNPGAQPAFLLHIDHQGTSNWIKSYGLTNRQEVTSCDVASDSGYVVVGTTSGFASTGTHCGFMFKTDPAGNLGCYDMPISVTDSAVALSSITFPLTYSSISLIDSLFLPVPVVTDQPSSFICSSTMNISQQKKTAFEFYPNPICSKATFFISHEDEYLLTTYDTFGKTIFKSLINSKETELDFSRFPNGIYFYQLSNSENNFTGKFIVAH
jgi:hypothetical protein